MASRVKSNLGDIVFHQAGTFSVASEDVLKNRAIKKAKRRNIGSEVKPDEDWRIYFSLLIIRNIFSLRTCVYS